MLHLLRYNGITEKLILAMTLNFKIGINSYLITKYLIQDKNLFFLFRLSLAKWKFLHFRNIVFWVWLKMESILIGPHMIGKQKNCIHKYNIGQWDIVYAKIHTTLTCNTQNAKNAINGIITIVWSNKDGIWEIFVAEIAKNFQTWIRKRRNEQ